MCRDPRRTVVASRVWQALPLYEYYHFNPQFHQRDLGASSSWELRAPAAETSKKCGFSPKEASCDRPACISLTSLPVLRAGASHVYASKCKRQTGSFSGGGSLLRFRALLPPPIAIDEKSVAELGRPV